jgi:hypothetical protein
VRSLVVACLAVLALAGPAAAAVDQESLLQDDPLIVYADSDPRLNRVFTILKNLGVDRVRVSVFWNLIAPNPKSLERPSFRGENPSSPDAYPSSVWQRYDRIVLLAQRHGLGVLFTVTGPAPAWATRSRRRGYSVYKPHPSDFRDFVTAVGHRYSGRWVDESPASPPPPAPEPFPLPIGPPQLGGQPPPSPPQASQVLPRVGHWSLYNEPNFPTWLAPQSRRTRLRGGLVPFSPHHYRRLVAAAWDGLRSSGHGSDLILIGETAPRGGRRGINTTLPPITFLRELFCLSPAYRPFRGAAARARGCPDSGPERSAFRSANGGLFAAAGFAHHAYSLDNRPTWRHRSRNVVALGSINRLTSAYDRALFAWGDLGERDIWITEYGYQTAPDPYVGIPLERQALWSSWAEYLAYRNPRIASMAQFLLNDDGPDPQFDPDDFRYWRTWQSGLMTHGGEPKPAFSEYPFPIHVAPTSVRPGGAVTVFGLPRPAPDNAQIVAHIQLRPAGGDWQTLESLTVTGTRGYLSQTIRPSTSGEVRILWQDPSTGYFVGTRAVPVTLG